MCDRWRFSFASFLADMGECPEDHSIERIDNDGDYQPSNCKWASRLEQANNKRNVEKIEFGGLSLSMTEWSRRVGLPIHTLRGRYRLGWPVDLMLTVPNRQEIEKHDAV